MLGKNRVVITGLGVLAANGIGKEAFWDSLLAGRSGIKSISLCDTSDLPSKIGGEVSDFDPEPWLKGRIKAKHLSRNTQLAVASAYQALEDAGLNANTPDFSTALPIILGISMSGFDLIEKEMDHFFNKGSRFVMPSVVGCIHIASASTISDLFGFPCTLNVLSNSCVGGIDSIAAAYRQVRSGKTDIALAGGSDAPLSTSLMSGFCAARMLCTKNEHPETASSPFDARREHGVLAEGASMLMIESLDHALDRGAEPYAEILGFGSATDPDEEAGGGLEYSMSEAMDNAGLSPRDIDLISAHAPSEEQLDATEVRLIKKLMGDQAYQVPVYSIKGATGNPLAAGGAMQAVTACLSLQQEQAPPTVNYEVPDPDCDLDIIKDNPRTGQFRTVLINSHGIGKVNSSLVLGKYAE